MENKKVSLSVPIEFQELESYKVEDLRFFKVKIFLMHLGVNLNNSLFTKEAVENAIPTLANTPILAYIEDEDFTDHRQDIEVKNGEIKIKYKCNGVGVIPETHNAHFEEKVCSDGITRTFLVCAGLIWRKWDEVDDILNRDKIKSQSMELFEDYTGHFNKDGNFEFDQFKFFGGCLLGEDVTPAMTGANVEVQFTANEIAKKLEQFTEFMNQSSTTEVEVDDIENNKIGGTDMANVNKNVSDAPIVEEPVVENTEFSKDTTVATPIETEAVLFSATVNQKRDAIRNALDNAVVKDADGNVVEETYYYVNDFDDSVVYVEKDHWVNGDYECKYGKFEYSFDEESLTATITSEFTEMVKIWVTKEENELINEARTNYEVLKTDFDTYKENHSYENTEFSALSEYKAEKEDAEKSDVLNKYATKLGDKKEFKELKASYSKYTIEDLNKECIYIRGLYADDSDAQPKADTSLKFSVERKETVDSPYGDLFEKFGK